MLTAPSRKCVELMSLRGHLCGIRPLLSGELQGLASFVPGGEEFPDLRPAGFFHMLIYSPSPQPYSASFCCNRRPHAAANLPLPVPVPPPPVAVTEDHMLSSFQRKKYSSLSFQWEATSVQRRVTNPDSGTLL